MVNVLRKQGWSAIIKLLAGFVLISPALYSGTVKNASLLHDNLKRNYKIYIPTGFNNYAPMPLVIALHGKGGNAESMILLTRKGFDRLADRDGFLMVYPDGIELNWNDGRKDEQSNDRAHRENIDDVGFISALIDTLIKDYHADPHRVYVTGISNGAIMSYRLACELSGRIAAIAPVDGSIPYQFFPECFPAMPVSVLAINNTKDPLVPYQGGEIHGSLGKVRLGRVLSVEESIGFWVNRNKCSNVPVVYELPDTDPSDGTRVTMEQFINKSDGTEVVLYTVEGGGHTWPGGFQYLPVRIIGRTCRDFDANDVIWSFFRKHKR